MPVITPAQRAALQRQIEQGAEAAALQGKMKLCPSCGSGTNILQERRNQIVKEARDWFRQPGSSKDDHVAVRYLAALAEIVAIEAALDSRERASASAHEQLYSDQTAEV